MTITPTAATEMTGKKIIVAAAIADGETGNVRRTRNWKTTGLIKKKRTKT